MDKVLPKLVELGTTWGIRVLGVLLAVIVAWIIAGWLGRMVNRTVAAKIDKTLADFLGSLTKWLVLAAALLGVLGVFGIQTTSFAALIGAGGLAIGLSFQSTLSNFAAGVMLIVFRPIRVGEVAKVAGLAGAVDSVNLFTTELVTPDNRRLIIPNDKVFGAIIENWTRAETRRIDIPVGVDYAADIDKTREVLLAAAKSTPGVLDDPAPDAFLAGLGASSVDWQVRVWCNTADYWDVHQATIRACKKALDEAQISIPFPQMDVHLDK